MRANQLRLYFASFAYVLMHALRRLGAEGTELARAQCTTLRLKLLKVGARVRITARKVWLSFAQSYPYANTFVQVLENLRRQAMWRRGWPESPPRRTPRREPRAVREKVAKGTRARTPR